MVVDVGYIYDVRVGYRTEAQVPSMTRRSCTDVRNSIWDRILVMMEYRPNAWRRRTCDVECEGYVLPAFRCLGPSSQTAHTWRCFLMRRAGSLFIVKPPSTYTMEELQCCVEKLVKYKTNWKWTRRFSPHPLRYSSAQRTQLSVLCGNPITSLPYSQHSLRRDHSSSLSVPVPLDNKSLPPPSNGRWNWNVFPPIASLGRISMENSQQHARTSMCGAGAGAIDQFPSSGAGSVGFDHVALLATSSCVREKITIR